MIDRTAPVKDLITAYLATYIDLIKDEDNAEGAPVMRANRPETARLEEKP